MRTRVLALAALPLLLVACSQAPQPAPSPSASEVSPEASPEPETSAEPSGSHSDGHSGDGLSSDDERSASIGVMEVGDLTVGLEDLPEGYSQFEAADSEITVYGSATLQECLGMSVEVGDDAELRTTSATPLFANEGADIRVMSAAALFDDVDVSVEFFEALESSYGECFDEEVGEGALSDSLTEVDSAEYPEGIRVAAFRTEAEDAGTPLFLDTVLLQAGELHTVLYVYSSDSPVSTDDIQSLVDLMVDRLDEATSPPS